MDCVRGKKWQEVEYQTKDFMRNHRMLTIFLVVFVDLLGFSLILPLLPYYAEQHLSLIHI